MTITTAMCTTAKAALLDGVHLAANTYKMALIKTAHSGTYGAATTHYGTAAGGPTVSNLGTDEVANGSGYTSGGFTMAGRTAGSSGTTAWIDWTTDPTWAAATISADGCMLYNDTVVGKPAISVHAFAGAPISSTAGTFTITLPTADASNALLRMA